MSALSARFAVVGAGVTGFVMLARGRAASYEEGNKDSDRRREKRVNHGVER
jgi:microcompartment protein CcmK/EutM